MPPLFCLVYLQLQVAATMNTSLVASCVNLAMDELDSFVHAYRGTYLYSVLALVCLICIEDLVLLQYYYYMYYISSRELACT